ncbi:NUDIX domain-containing protein [Nonomuraea sp. NBC_01738]|uniref:NUDIX hydrolase n=1 Tax=Nonomuraea sp. NBC_01738 TaxID=2976003 RepID=UPI002E11FDC6|nr:NUDIX domain-containing protein [Nonomuraea sp. NBC_01738]
MDSVLSDIRAEWAAQFRQWGPQRHPDGTGPSGTEAADAAKRATDEAAQQGTLTWRHILHEEVLEAFAESDPAKLRAELVQVAAVAAQWIHTLDDPRPPRFRTIVDVHVLLMRDGEVLLMRRAGTGYRDGEWHLPSGHLEPAESALSAAARETLEEVGVRVHGLTFAHVMHRAPDRVGLFFTATGWDGEPYNAEPHKCSELGWFPIDELPPDTVDYPAAAIAAIGRGEPFGTHAW